MTTSFEFRKQEAAKILVNLAARVESLEKLLQDCSSHWGYEDPVYRFYHQSFKVFGLQQATEEIVKQLHALGPHLPLNDWFLEIVEQGTGKEFTIADNDNWLAVTRPIMEAFFHARYFLEMACKYGRELKEAPDMMPSGWAAVLYLYNIR
jgi:hypothetical protein